MSEELEIKIIIEEPNTKLDQLDREWLGEDLYSVVTKGSVLSGAIEVGFLISQDEDGDISLTWKSIPGETQIGGEIVDIGALQACYDGSFTNVAKDEDAALSIFEENSAEPSEDAVLEFLKRLRQIDEHIKGQEFYKDAALISAAWKLMEIDKKKQFAEQAFEKALSLSSNRTLLKYPMRSVREWAIKRIGEKSNRKIGR